ncbi:uncharacterized protein LOC144330366 [Macaca mulatta]
MTGLRCARLREALQPRPLLTAFAPVPRRPCISVPLTPGVDAASKPTFPCTLAGEGAPAPSSLSWRAPRRAFWAWAPSRQPVPADTTFLSGGGGAAGFPSRRGPPGGEGFPGGAAPGWAGAAHKLRSCTNTAGLRCTRSCGPRARAAGEGAEGCRRPPHSHTRPLHRRPGRRSSSTAAPAAPAPGRACRAATRRASSHSSRAAWGPLAGPAACRPRPPAEQPHLPSSCPGSGLRTPASTVPLPPRAAAFGRLRDSSSLHALPILKTNRRRRLPAALVGLPPARASRRLGSLLAGLGRDARAVTPHSRCRSLGAPRTRAVCLASALPPSVSPPVLRCSVRIARL